MMNRRLIAVLKVFFQFDVYLNEIIVFLLFIYIYREREREIDFIYL